MAWKALITKEGLKLLEGMLGGGKLTITRAVVGSAVTPIEELADLTDISDVIPAHIQVLIRPKSESEGERNGRTVEVQIFNLGVTEISVIRQIGLFAITNESDEATLLAVYQNEFGEEIPPYKDFPNFTLKFFAGLDVSVTENITVLVDHDAFITQDDLIVHKAEVKEMIDRYLASFIVFDFVLPEDAWVDAGEEYGLFRYYADIRNNAISLVQYPDITLDMGSLQIASDACVASLAEIIEDGKIRMYAQNVPEAALKGSCRLWNKTTTGAKDFNFAVPVGSWNDGGEEMGRYRYYADVLNSLISVSLYPEVILDINSLETSYDAVIASVCDIPENGKLRLFAQAIPADTLTGNCRLWFRMQQGGGGGTYDLPIAGPDTLGGIKSSDSIAVDADGTAHAHADVSPEHISTEEETDEMLDEVFGTDSDDNAE